MKDYIKVENNVDGSSASRLKREAQKHSIQKQNASLTIWECINVLDNLDRKYL